MKMLSEKKKIIIIRSAALDKSLKMWDLAEDGWRMFGRDGVRGEV